MDMELPASFFKVLIDDFESRLRIPLTFAKIFDHVMPQSARLEVKSGETWSVKIERIGEYYVFTDGWPKFVKDHDLKENEFLVFSLQEDDIFKVKIYGTSENKRHFCATASPIPDPRFIQSLSIDQPSTEINSFPQEDSSKKFTKKFENDKASLDDEEYFTKVLTKFHRYKMNLPMGFAKKHGLLFLERGKDGLKNRKEVDVQYMNGRFWRVKLQWYPNNSMMVMKEGWRDFLENNALVFGKEYTYQFIPEIGSIRVHP